MMRVLIATAIREAIPGAGWAREKGTDALLYIVKSGCTAAAAPPAPAEGLCFVGAEYE
jgi:hypothetical protein